MAAAGVPSTLFVLGALASAAGPRLRAAVERGHAIGCHGFNHDRPLTIPMDRFRSELQRAKAVVEDAAGVTVTGYRAPCYSLDRERLDVVRSLGFEFDSSKIQFRAHPLYGNIDLTGFFEPAPGIWVNDGFVEFEVTTINLYGHRFPISGGGYIRLLPWQVTRYLLKRVAGPGLFYTLYCHPFELSRRSTPFPLHNANISSWFRFSVGRSSVEAKVKSLIRFLRERGYRFVTLPQLRSEMITPSGWK